MTTVFKFEKTIPEGVSVNQLALYQIATWLERLTDENTVETDAQIDGGDAIVTAAAPSSQSDAAIAPVAATRRGRPKKNATAAGAESPVQQSSGGVASVGPQMGSGGAATPQNVPPAFAQPPAGTPPFAQTTGFAPPPPVTEQQPAAAMQQPAMPAPPTSAAAQTLGLTLDVLRSKFMEVHARKAGLPFRVMSAQTWSDGTPKPQWMTLEGIPPESYERIVFEVESAAAL